MDDDDDNDDDELYKAIYIYKGIFQKTITLS